MNPLAAKYAVSKAYNSFNRTGFTIGTKSTNTINVSVQLKDPRLRAVPGPLIANVYVSDAITGLGITATILTSPIVIGTKGTLLATPTSAKMVTVLSDVNGAFDLNLIQTASPQVYYLCVAMPDGSIAVSGAITF